MLVQRDYYLNKLINKQNNGLVKIVTGVRRCGKSSLLFGLYYDYLLSQGIPESQIITLQLDDIQNARYRNPFELEKYIRERIQDKYTQYYVFIDEIQFVREIRNPWIDHSLDIIGFTDVVIGLLNINNIDLYITGSNSRMLSKDVLTQFRDRGDEIKLHPFSYSEFCRAKDGDSEAVWRDFLTYGGLPRIIHFQDPAEKSTYLANLFENTYIQDVLERNQIKNEKEVLDNLIRIVASSVGSLTNPHKIANTFKSTKNIPINSNTVSLYLDHFIDAFLLNKVYRYDVKGRKYIGSPQKYYFIDQGLRNALLNFRQQEENHIIENIIYNELILRGYNVDVGAVNHRYKDSAGKDIKTWLEIDFIASKASKKVYIQSALNIDTREKREQEIASLKKVNDSFKKIVVVRDHINPWIDDYGINYVGIREFLSGYYIDLEMV